MSHQAVSPVGALSAPSNDRAGPGIFRPLNEKRELYDHFRLRHEAYIENRYRLQPNVDGLDIDRHDIRALHVGAYHLTDDGERVIGGIRMIFPRREPRAASLVRDILSDS